jgi:hypothetical protein
MTSASPALESVDVRDVRMIQRREGLRFARESREPIGIARPPTPAEL